MGNTSSQDSKKSLDYVVNQIASQYIRSQNFKDMKELSNLEYCDKLVIITSKILLKYLDNNQITYLAQKKGITGEAMEKDSVVVLNRNNLDNLDIKDTVKKRRVCIGIARHYIQIANLFAAIASTINPKYEFKDIDGEKKSVSLENKEDIPENSNTNITRNNLCSNRVNALLNNQDLSILEKQYQEGTVTLNPDICSFNCSTCPIIKNLGDEPGIPELEQLYLDKYDYDTGKFIGMTKNMAIQYSIDLKNLYTAFTGNDSLPETIKRFSDIKLKDYYESAPCKEGLFTKPVTGKASGMLFYDYVENIKSMMSSTNKYHNILLDILDKLFVYSLDETTNKKNIIINPNLKLPELKELTQLTISTINQLYISCEQGYIRGVNIYTAIAHKQFIKTAQSQIENLKSIKDLVAASNEDISPSEFNEVQKGIPPSENVTSESISDINEAKEAMEEAKESMNEVKSEMIEAKDQLNEEKEKDLTEQSDEKEKDLTEQSNEKEKDLTEQSNEKEKDLTEQSNGKEKDLTEQSDEKEKDLTEQSDENDSFKKQEDKLKQETDDILDKIEKVEEETKSIKDKQNELNKQLSIARPIPVISPTPEPESAKSSIDNIQKISDEK